MSWVPTIYGNFVLYSGPQHGQGLGSSSQGGWSDLWLIDHMPENYGISSPRASRHFTFFLGPGEMVLQNHRDFSTIKYDFISPADCPVILSNKFYHKTISARPLKCLTVDISCIWNSLSWNLCFLWASVVHDIIPKNYPETHRLCPRAWDTIN